MARIQGGAPILAHRLPDFDDPSAFREPTIQDQVADADSARIISDSGASQFLQEVARLCRERWDAWHEVVQQAGLRPVYAAVHPESSPWVFPAYVDSPDQRQQFMKTCLKKGAVLFPWPALPAEVIERAGEPVNRWRRLVCAPVH